MLDNINDGMAAFMKSLVSISPCSVRCRSSDRTISQTLGRFAKRRFGHVAFYIDLLAERGPLLDEPYTRQLGGNLRELRFYLGRERRRISYYLATGQRAVLLTVFGKQRARERAESERAHRC